MPDYISYIRDLVGPRPIIVAGASVILKAPDGRVLMHKRSDNGLWSLPGGALELGETLEGAAVREVKEETGLTVVPKCLILCGVISGDAGHYTYPNGDEVWNVTAVFACSSPDRADLRLSAEATGFSWIDCFSSALPLSPPTHRMLTVLGSVIKERLGGLG